MMRWTPSKLSDQVPWWAWLLVPVWGPAMIVLIAGLDAVELKQRIMGPSSDWRPWFAWHPVRIYYQERRDDIKVWLEWIERRTYGPLGEVKYRLAPAALPPAGGR